MKATVTHINSRVSSDEIRHIYKQPTHRDTAAGFLDWFSRIDRRIKLAVLTAAWLWMVYGLCAAL
ncbi:MAG: hypothetical protein M0R80_13605 [Proteobacteria bacterium]|jgi:hypothetical protein|nr:hypothetical protein [Pseudomonadota bacterium]